MTDQDDDPIRLKGAQHDIRDSFFSHESGLFTLPCVPGSGKSTTVYRLAPEDILRRYVAGDATPEQHIAIVSFNRDEAAGILPEICEQLRTIVKHDLRPVASEVSEEEVEVLIQRLQNAPFIGTIDSLLCGVLEQFAHDIGFDGMPSVGNEALLARVHTDCYEQLKTEPEHRTKLEALESAYPGSEYDASPAEMLESALTYCRDRRLSTQEFQQELEQTQEAVYPNGKPKKFTDIVTAVKRAVDDDRIGNTVREQVEEKERDDLINADQNLYEAWTDRINDFCEVLAAYRELYREVTREYGVLSHTDTAYLIDSFFGGTLAELDDRNIDETCQQRVLKRYRGRLETLVIDEAQDVSAIQHAALSHLVGPDIRVFACGDTLQSIYTWRHADPKLFQSATETGKYLGVDWDTHVNETATTTYRCVPDVSAAINKISEPMFADASRGNLGTLDTTYPPLESARESSEETSVHITSFESNRQPGTEPWICPKDGNGEADLLATHLSKGLDDGTFTDADGDPHSITVLFQRSTVMSDYETAFEEIGLRVKNASEDLFDSSAVKTVFAVCDWLIEPESPEHLRRLIAEAGLGLASIDTTSEEEEDGQWDIDVMLESDDLSDSQQLTLTGLQQLRDRSDRFDMLPASTYLEEIIEQLSLRADSNDLCPDTEAQRRIANLDALVELITEWESDEHYNPKELSELVEPFREDTDRGPYQPSTSAADHDVTFRTVHRTKGDEDDIIAVADPGFNADWIGPHNTRLITQGSVAGLAPPTDVEVPTEVDLPPFDSGLYDPDAEFTQDIGLRWVTSKWQDSVNDTAAQETLVGPERLQRLVQNERAELWRVLFVALTRARDHLLIPLPQSLANDKYRDRWTETLRDGLSYDGDPKSYTLPSCSGEIEIGVNDVDLSGSWNPGQQSELNVDVTVTPPNRDELDAWVPRFLNPSTMYPLTESLEEHALEHLSEDAIHTEANEVSDDLPLQFDKLGPEDVGSCLHEVLTTLVARDVSESELHSMDGMVTAVFDDVIHEADHNISNSERDSLWTFFSSVIDEFIESDLWDRIQNAESVRVEQPIDGLVNESNIEIELHGTADFVVDSPSGERYVTDTKIALTEQTSATEKRYELQVAAYAYLFAQQCDQVTVCPTVETFGAARNTVTDSWPVKIIERRISTLLD